MSARHLADLPSAETLARAIAARGHRQVLYAGDLVVGGGRIERTEVGRTAVSGAA